MKIHITKAQIREQLADMKESKFEEYQKAAEACVAKLKKDWLDKNSDTARWYKDYWRYARNLRIAGFNIYGSTEPGMWGICYHMEKDNPVIPKGFYDDYKEGRSKIYQAFNVAENIVYQYPARKAFELLVAKGLPLKASYEMKPPAVIDDLDISFMVTKGTDVK